MARPSAASAGALAECPEAFLCPITQDCLIDPVFATDGHTYERSAIDRWLRSHNTSPTTNEPLESAALLPNHAMKSQIAAWRESQKGQQGQQRQLKALMSKVHFGSTSDEVAEALRKLSEFVSSQEAVLSPVSYTHLTLPTICSV